MRQERMTVLYLRLSREDGGRTESASIASQREQLLSFAALRGWTVSREYVDDGYSGLTLDRPAMRELLRDCAAGRIERVLVKDLSRLGRNSARVSDLLEEVFPRQGVRCVSLGEGYDSADDSVMARFLPLTCAVNELYARDLSVKIRAALTARMRQGIYVGSRPPYGYRRDPGCPERLSPQPGEAEVVRELFLRAADGELPAALAADCNRRGIAAPGGGTWTRYGVGRILRDRVYLGELAQGKCRRPNCKSTFSKRLAPEDWILVPGTHEPLVEGSVWERVQAGRAARRTRPGLTAASDGQTLRGGFVNELVGIAVCAGCGRALSAAEVKRPRPVLLCGGRKAGRGCSPHRAVYEDLLVLRRTLGDAPIRLLVGEAETRRSLGGVVRWQRILVADAQGVRSGCAWVSDATPQG